MDITKKISLSDIKDILGGNFPSYHPTSYFEGKIKEGHAFLATKQEKPAGFFIYGFLWGNTPFIELIKVKKEYQRQGAGSALLHAAKNEIKDLGFSALISSTEESNPMGKAFHAKHGFEYLNTLALSHGPEQFLKLTLS